MLKQLLVLAVLPLFCAAQACAQAQTGTKGHRPHGAKMEKAAVQPVKSEQAAQPVALSAAGKNNPLPSGGYFTWQFDKKPQLGTLIIKIRAYDKSGKQVSRYEIYGESGMPEMRAHDSGPVKFQLNKKGDYLLPVEVAMPGQWRTTVRIKQEGREILAGNIDFAL